MNVRCKIFSASNRVKCYVRVRPLNVDELEREDETAVEVSEDKKEVRKLFCWSLQWMGTRGGGGGVLSTRPWLRG